jgi:predicted ArsR family transcriptional regulator
VAEAANPERHRALADKSRLALLRVLEASDPALDAQTLADRVGLHVNTVRWHLGILAEAELISEERRRPHGRGRPRLAYRLVPGALEDQPGGFRLLSEILADSLIRGGHAELAEETGRAHGRTLVQPSGAKTAKQATAQVMELLEGFGFRPRLQRERGGQRIAMGPCPFGDTAVRYPAIVCPVHLGLMRGALEALQAPVEAATLEPFVRPDLCVAHLRPVRATAGSAVAPTPRAKRKQRKVT